MYCSITTGTQLLTDSPCHYKISAASQTSLKGSVCSSNRNAVKESVEYQDKQNQNKTKQIKDRTKLFFYSSLLISG